jgi:hypothetical protein
MRLLSAFAALCLATQAHATPLNFEVSPNDEVALKPHKLEAVPYYYQTTNRGEGFDRRSIAFEARPKNGIALEPQQPGITKHHFQQTQNGGKVFEHSSIKVSPVSDLEKRRGGRGGGHAARGGRHSSGGGGHFSRGSSSGSGLATGALVGSGLGLLAGSSIGAHSGTLFDDDDDDDLNLKAPSDCRFTSDMDDFRLYFVSHKLPGISELNYSIISIRTDWHLTYQNKLRAQLEKKLGFVSIPDPRFQCGWAPIMDVTKAAVHRGLVELHPADGNLTHTIAPELEEQIREILVSTYPTLEITLTCLSIVFFVVLLLSFSCLERCCFGRSTKRPLQRDADLENAPVYYEWDENYRQTHPPPKELPVVPAETKSPPPRTQTPPPVYTWVTVGAHDLLREVR